MREKGGGWGGVGRGEIEEESKRRAGFTRETGGLVHTPPVSPRPLVSSYSPVAPRPSGVPTSGRYT